MISLLYRAWSSAQPAVSLDRPGTDRFAGYLGSLIGIGMPTLRDRDAVPDFAKLHYAGRLARHGGGAAGLEAILTDFFQVPVQVQQFVGHWMRLPADGMFRLRSGPDAGALGQDTVLGKQVWNAQHKFRLLIGPLDMDQARTLMPNAQGMRRLSAWVHQYAGLTQEWGKPVQPLQEGDVVWCPPGVKHWHGAAPGSALTHIAMTGTLEGKSVQWMEKVSDEQYLSN